MALVPRRKNLRIFIRPSLHLISMMFPFRSIFSIAIHLPWVSFHSLMFVCSLSFLFISHYLSPYSLLFLDNVAYSVAVSTHVYITNIFASESKEWCSHISIALVSFSQYVSRQSFLMFMKSNWEFFFLIFFSTP